MTMEINKIKNRLEAIVGEGALTQDAPMAKYTSFRAGGSADLLAEVQSREKLMRVLEVLSEEDCPHILLGNGTNILVRDGGYRGVMVKLGEEFGSAEADGLLLRCGGGVLLAAAAAKAAACGLTGLEFASGIPGSVGGAVFMNAGAYDGEIRDVLEEVHLISADGSREFILKNAELELGYRHSLLHDTGDVAVEAVFRLKEGNKDEIQSRMSELKSRRNAKQPVNFPSAGSFFKRPEGHFAGKLIQDAGLKGLTVGGAQVSELHSGFVINRGGATATDILQLMEIVQARVLDKFGVRLEPEVMIVGE